MEKYWLLPICFQYSNYVINKNYLIYLLCNNNMFLLCSSINIEISQQKYAIFKLKMLNSK